VKRIALCIGNQAERGRRIPKAYLHGYNLIKDKIINKYEDDIDIFLHSWEPELKEDLLNLYNPKSYLFEDQINFGEEYKNCDPSITLGNSYESNFSMFYSRYSVNKIFKEYSEKNKIDYDWVIFCRYDLGVEKIHSIEFDKNYDNNYLYISMYDQINAGPSDHWFYGNKNNMDKVLSIYPMLKEYCTPESEYIRSAKENWIDSNISNRFSCELLFGNGNSEGEKIPNEFVFNPHLIYKWHLYKNDLWNLDKIKFIITEKEKNYFLNFPEHDNLIKF
jgi:hypothetical protein